LAVAILAVVAIGILLLRLQPGRTATVFISGGFRVIARTTPLYVRVPHASQCRVPMAGDQLAFVNDIDAGQFMVHVRFNYNAPAWMPAGWRGLDWCESLARRIRVPEVTASEALDRRREAGDRIAAAIERDLRGDGVAVSAVSARIDLPLGFERLRPVPEIASRAHAAAPVIFIGLDGADWNLLDGYMASGAMPNLKKLVDSGARGTLQTEMPPLSPIVWTTM